MNTLILPNTLPDPILTCVLNMARVPNKGDYHRSLFLGVSELSDAQVYKYAKYDDREFVV